MTTRFATHADIAALLAIWNPVIRDTIVTLNAVEKTAEDLAQMIADKAAAGHAFLVAEDAGRVHGFASYGQFRAGIGYARCMEHTIVLGPDARGHGIGRALITAIEDHARAGGAHSIFAGVTAENAQGHAFHAAMGYTHVVTLREVGFKFGRWLDLHLMQKFLT
ncbi:GNAT family N-acetyltransferase [Pseudorhodobacter ferrugineus]|uniref:GNAT family N-acetyltransferase n=1 Tax=Pseudorhodobacter ferrugineus TaxID=77008 RepID=UPI0003B673E4|nr:GNAT family N-acetyltransferase [Pseudorhodobacter ferrugineus]